MFYTWICFLGLKNWISLSAHFVMKKKLHSTYFIPAQKQNNYWTNSENNSQFINIQHSTGLKLEMFYNNQTLNANKSCITNFQILYLQYQKHWTTEIWSFEGNNREHQRATKKLTGFNEIKLLSHFMPLISFDTPWKHQKTRGFQTTLLIDISFKVKREGKHERLISFPVYYFFIFSLYLLFCDVHTIK